MLPPRPDNRAIVLVSISVISLIGLVLVAKSVFAPEEWYRDGKIRAAYVERLNESLASRLRDVGMNCVILRLGWFDPINQSQVAQLKDCQAACSRHGLNLVVAVYFCSSDSGIAVQGRQYVAQDGEEKGVSCPTDPAYWAVLGDELVGLAGMGVSGVVLDMEMYTGQVRTYSPAGCMCDACFSRFIQRPGMLGIVELNGSERSAWLEENGYSAGYGDRMRIEVANLARATAKRVGSRSLLGFMLWDDTWFYNGVLDGFGSVTRSVVVLDESSYDGWSKVNAERAVQLGSRAIYLPGLHCGRVAGEQFADQAWTCAGAVGSAGYWIFGLRDDYWDWLKDANRRVEALA